MTRGAKFSIIASLIVAMGGWGLTQTFSQPPKTAVEEKVDKKGEKKAEKVDKELTNYATIIVRVQPGAVVKVDGKELTKETGARRTFYTQELVPGFTYSHIVEAQWKVGGKDKTVSKIVNFRALQTVEVDVSKEEALPLPKKKDDNKKDDTKKDDTKKDDKKKDDKKDDVKKKDDAKKDDKNPATTAAPRDTGWVKRHEGFVDIAKKGEVDLLFLGDSITDGWRNQKAWKEHFEPLKSANFGIGGDQTQHVLWRIQNGELDGIKPKVAVVMIGTNNTGGHSAEQIAEGITAIVKTVHEKTPSTKVLLLAVFPRDEKPGTMRRDKIEAINKIISKLDDGKKVRYLDIGAKFTEPDGTLTKAIMPDFLHLSARGYEIWAEAIMPAVKELLGTK